MSTLTPILSQIEEGDATAAEQLLPLVYNELRRLATARLARESPGQTLQATALVHEAYLRLVDDKQAQHWNSRGHFFSAAAEAMRRILVEQARIKSRQKRGGNLKRREFERNQPSSLGLDTNVLAIDEALTNLAAERPDAAELVKLRYFGGMTLAEAAQVLQISGATADRRWKFARAWLARQLQLDFGEPGRNS